MIMQNRAETAMKIHDHQKHPMVSCAIEYFPGLSHDHENVAMFHE